MNADNFFKKRERERERETFDSGTDELDASTESKFNFIYPLILYYDFQLLNGESGDTKFPT